MDMPRNPSVFLGADQSRPRTKHWLSISIQRNPLGFLSNWTRFVCTNKQNNTTKIFNKLFLISDVVYIKTNGTKPHSSIRCSLILKCVPWNVYSTLWCISVTWAHWAKYAMFEWVWWWEFSFNDTLPLYFTKKDEPTTQILNVDNK